MTEDEKTERDEVAEDGEEDLELSEQDVDAVKGGTNAWPSKLTGPPPSSQ